MTCLILWHLSESININQKKISINQNQSKSISINQLFGQIAFEHAYQCLRVSEIRSPKDISVRFKVSMAMLTNDVKLLSSSRQLLFVSSSAVRMIRSFGIPALFALETKARVVNNAVSSDLAWGTNRCQSSVFGGSSFEMLPLELLIYQDTEKPGVDEKFRLLDCGWRKTIWNASMFLTSSKLKENIRFFSNTSSMSFSQRNFLP